MEYKYSTLMDSSLYDREGLCPGIDLRRHVAAELEEVGCIRAQEDWRRLVGPLPRPYGGSLGPDFSFVTCALPGCIPERMEIVSYALDFGFMHDDIIDTDVHHASLDEVENTLTQCGSGKVEDKGSDGKRQIVTQILREMMAIDPERAMGAARAWAAGARNSGRRKEDTNFKSLEEYIPYRAYDVGYEHWHGLVNFGCAITIPEEEEEEAKKLILPALIHASLLNDLFSFEKEKNDANVQNAVWIVMNEHGFGEEKAREFIKKRIRLECANYVRIVKETNARTDISDDLKRYITANQYTLSGNTAWSTNCPRYNGPTKFNELQILRAKHGLAKYPSTWTWQNGTSEHVEDKAQESQTNGLKRKRNGVNGDEKRANGTNGIKKLVRNSQLNLDSITLDDVVQLASNTNLANLSDNVVLQPYRYLISLPSKGFRDQAVDSINKWLRVSPKSVNKIKEVVKMLHSASLMLDDLEDDSPLRRGKPSTHNIYGMAQTINSATYQFIAATAMATQLENPDNLHIFVDEVQQLHVGQSYDLYWTYNTLCPTVTEYLKMVDMKTGGLFRMLTRMMIAESPVGDKILDGDMNMFSCLIGRYFQIRDDYQNLASADYAKAKGFAEDLDEGKYSFMLIHCIQTLELDPELAGEMMQLRSFLMKRRLDGKLSHEAKREVLAIMKKTGSLEHTLSVLRELHAELEKEVARLEVKFGEDNFTLRMMLELLKV